MSRRLCGLVCLVSLALQAGLPLAHEWRTAADEAAYHAGAERQDGPTVKEDPARSGRPRHHHHDPETCQVCPALAGLREFLLSPSITLTAPSRSIRLAAVRHSAVSISRTHRSASPRAPPLPA